jgi:Pvc16 N-terminal domain
MIDDALTLLREELEAYVTPDAVVIGNIAHWEAENNENLKESLVLTLVNVEEESSLKNRSNQQRYPDGKIRYEQPPIFINLYLLISANFSGSREGYSKALGLLSRVLQFFQSKTVFTLANSPNNSLNQETGDRLLLLQDMKLYIEFYTLNFEQINHLWGSLGGNQMPFAMYKVRLVKLQERRSIEAPLIETIETIIHKVADKPLT